MGHRDGHLSDYLVVAIRDKDIAHMIDRYPGWTIEPSQISRTAIPPITDATTTCNFDDNARTGNDLAHNLAHEVRHENVAVQIDR